MCQNKRLIFVVYPCEFKEMCLKLEDENEKKREEKENIDSRRLV